MSWEQHLLVSARITADRECRAMLRYSGKEETVTFVAGEIKEIPGIGLSFLSSSAEDASHPLS